MNAIKSLYGKGHADATLRTVRTRECVAMPGARNQTVLTPLRVLACVWEYWPEGIAYDPSWAPGAFTEAERRTGTHGLIDAWVHRTYCNPPFGLSLRDPERDGAAFALETKTRRRIRDAHKRAPRKSEWPAGTPVPPERKANLGDWCKHHIENGTGERIMLVPNRTHRKWLRKWRHECDVLVDLNPIAFAGHAQAFPQPLTLGLKGATPQRVMAFARIFGKLGDPCVERAPHYPDPETQRQSEIGALQRILAGLTDDNYIARLQIKQRIERLQNGKA